VPNIRRAIVALALAGLFGVAAGLVKGDAEGLRAGLGNLSAPWLLVAFLPAVPYRTPARGALIGLTATLFALLGFYAALTLALAGHLGGGGPWAEFLVEVRANRVYVVLGLVTGPLAGAAGAWVGSRRRGLVPFVVGAALAAEIGVVRLVEGRQLLPPPLYLRWGVVDWTPYLGECAVGLVALLVVLVLRRRRRTGTVGP